MVEHANVASNNIHEPKGAAAASANTCYVADGAGSGSFTTVPAAAISGINNKNLIVLADEFANISAANSHWVATPLAGTITKVYSVINNAITTSDETITLKIGGVTVTNGTITITQAGSAAGDVDSCTPTSNNTVTAGQAIEIASAGDSGGTTGATFTILIDVS